MSSTAEAAQRRAAVVGAGVVGLSVAFFLQDEGYQVTVYDRGEVASGASAGNAGWICPAMVAPLPEPAVLRYGLRSLVRPSSPIAIPPSALPASWRFLAKFATNSTSQRWQHGLAGYAAINALALAAFDTLKQAGAASTVRDSAMIVAFENADQAWPIRHEMAAIAAGGPAFAVDELSDRELHDEQPMLAERARYGLRLHGQKYLQPLEFVRGLAESVTARGGQVITNAPVTAITGLPGGGVRIAAGQAGGDYPVCVLANGAWLGKLAAPLGARTPVMAGRGYSFTVRTPEPVAKPLYFPGIRVATCPAPGGIRVTGMMEFRRPDDPLDHRRVAAIVRSVSPYLPGVDWADRSNTWVGSRPVTADGLPLIGATNLPGAYVAGGHGMWGMTLGPATGQLLARQIATGERPAALASFDPRR